MANVAGLVYGRLKILYSDTIKGHPFYLCICECSKEIVSHLSDLKRSHTRSCGCLQKEKVQTQGFRNKTHGMVNSREFRSWEAMKRRCLNQKDPSYKNYGGRGILICDRWMKFENFYEDMGKRPEKMSLERINNNRGYSKDNCKWATMKEQQNNKRDKKISLSVQIYG